MKNTLMGKFGEEIAVSFLKCNGYRILERNWRFKRAEIDIIALTGSMLVFVEVKYRSCDFFGAPEEWIQMSKESLIADAASHFMQLQNWSGECRFDIISILRDSFNTCDIQHYTDAFFPGINAG
jgi:putative endonuclease